MKVEFLVPPVIGRGNAALSYWRGNRRIETEWTRGGFLRYHEGAVNFDKVTFALPFTPKRVLWEEGK